MGAQASAGPDTTGAGSPRTPPNTPTQTRSVTPVADVSPVVDDGDELFQQRLVAAIQSVQTEQSTSVFMPMDRAISPIFQGDNALQCMTTPDQSVRQIIFGTLVATGSARRLQELLAMVNLAKLSGNTPELKKQFKAHFEEPTLPPGYPAAHANSRSLLASFRNIIGEDAKPGEPDAPDRTCELNVVSLATARHNARGSKAESRRASEAVALRDLLLSENLTKHSVDALVRAVLSFYPDLPVHILQAKTPVGTGLVGVQRFAHLVTEDLTAEKPPLAEIADDSRLVRTISRAYPGRLSTVDHLSLLTAALSKLGVVKLAPKTATKVLMGHEAAAKAVKTVLEGPLIPLPPPVKPEETLPKKRKAPPRENADCPHCGESAGECSCTDFKERSSTRSGMRKARR